MSERAQEIRRAVAEALRAACRAEFGSDWNNDVADKFAAVAIATFLRLLRKELEIAGDD